jgi:hypothetical protein
MRTKVSVRKIFTADIAEGSMQSKIQSVKFMQHSAIPQQGEESIIEVCNTRWSVRVTTETFSDLLKDFCHLVQLINQFGTSATSRRVNNELGLFITSQTCYFCNKKE